MEIWKDIIGYEGKYQVSNLGRVKSLARNRKNQYNGEILLTPTNRGDGYFCVSLSKDGKTKVINIHNLVAEAFVDGYFPGAVVNHKDENRNNNNSDNLEWCTQRHNINWGLRNKKVSEKMTNGRLSKPVAQYKNGVLISVYPSVSEATRQTGFNQGYISSCARGDFEFAYGYNWKYIN